MTTVTTLRPGEGGSGTTTEAAAPPPRHAPSVAEWERVARSILGYPIDRIGKSPRPVRRRGEGWAPMLRRLLEPTDADLEAEFAPWVEESLEIAQQTFEAAAETWPEG